MGEAAEEHKACSIAPRPRGHRRPLDVAHPPRRLPRRPPLRRPPARPRHRPQPARRPPPQPRRPRDPRPTQQYRERPPRYEYRLTPKGVDLSPALVALMRWGDKLLARWRRPAHRARPRARAATRSTRPSCAGPATRPSHPPPSAAARTRFGGHHRRRRRARSARAARHPPRRAPRPGRDVRDRAHGTRVTYSPKVFIPLTMLCRDRCGYCTFAQPPARLEAPYLTPEQVLAIARRGRRGRLPRGPVHPRRAARAALPASPGGGSTSTATTRRVDYLAAMCRLVLDETGLLPHANAGALYADELARAAAGVASPGDDGRVAAPDLDCHRGAPDKDAGPPPGHARGRRRAGHPVHHRHPRRHRRGPGRPARRARGHRRRPRAATATCRR